MLLMFCWVIVIVMLVKKYIRKQEMYIEKRRDEWQDSPQRAELMNF
jgi:hypothetical protein